MLRPSDEPCALAPPPRSLAPQQEQVVGAGLGVGLGEEEAEEEEEEEEESAVRMRLQHVEMVEFADFVFKLCSLWGLDVDRVRLHWTLNLFAVGLEGRGKEVRSGFYLEKNFC